jgi:hypothetical protein
MDISRWRALALLFTAVLSTSLCAAQDQDGTGEITGRVVSAETGQPIEHAEVSLDLPLAVSHNWTRKATTDKDGHYALTWLPAGKFSVTATADNYVAQTFHHPDDTDALHSILVEVADAASVNSVDFRLDAAGSLHGSVVEMTGESVGEGVSVAAVQPYTRPDGAKAMKPVMAATTDASGHFVLGRLAPGVYRICVNGPNGFGFAPSKAKITYRETWLGDASTYDAAQTVEVRAGDAGPDLRIVAPRIGTHALTVVPVWSPPAGSAAKPDRYEAAIVGRNHSSKALPDGSQVIPDLPSGQYKVLVDAWQGVHYVGHGESEATIGDADDSVRVKVVPASPK